MFRDRKGKLHQVAWNYSRLSIELEKEYKYFKKKIEHSIKEKLLLKINMF